MRTLIPAMTLVFGGFFLAGCKNKDKDPPPPPPTANHGSINFKVTAYDAYGKIQSDASDFKISLVEDNVSAVTDAGGLASFSELVYGYHTPVITKTGYEGPLVTVYLDKPSHHASLPVAQHSPFTPSNINGKVFGNQSIFLSFNLAPQIAQGDTVKLAVIGSNASDMSARKYNSVDIIRVTANVVTDYNISTLPDFAAMVKGLDSAAVFYVTAIPVSYGLFNGNLDSNPQLLGRTPVYPGHVALVKSWKN